MPAGEDGDEQEEDADEEEEEDDTPTTDEALLLEMMDRCAHFLARPSLFVQHQALAVLAAALGRLHAHSRRNVLLPTVHRLWPALLARLHLALPGAPFLYYGDEIGMPNASGDDDLAKRTPMRWGASDDGGFVGAWLAPSTRDPAISVIGQRGDPNEVFEATRAAIALRASHPALAVGDLTLEGDLPNAVLGFWRTAGDDAVLVLANLSAREVIVSKGGVTPVDGTHHPADAPGALGLAPLAVRLFAPAR